MVKTHVLLRRADRYAPEPLGKGDVLVCSEKVVAVEEDLGRFASLEDVEVVDLEGKSLVPGLIDNHVHLMGGGGGGGPATRGPEIFLSELAGCGITTAVGILGTDGLTRDLRGLLAKVRALTAEGLTAFLWSGAYQYPPPTLCGSVQWDVLFIPEVVGVGEIAIADERGTHPTASEVARLTGEAALGARMAGKRGPVCLHVGNGREALDPLLAACERTEVRIDGFLPTHLNRTPDLLKRSIEFALKGGWMDFTTAYTVEGGYSWAVAASQATVEACAAGVPLERICFSTDGNGVHSFFDEEGNLTRMFRWPVSSLWPEARRLAVEHGWPLEEALAPVTINPARALGLEKGTIAAGRDADLLVLDDDLMVESVYARGRCLVREGEAVVRGKFEPEA
ncbi:beta-aspartyl-peptidase [Nitrospinota bacterium]